MQCVPLSLAEVALLICSSAWLHSDITLESAIEALLSSVFPGCAHFVLLSLSVFPILDCATLISLSQEV